MNNLNRWVYACAGVLILLCAGVIYAWTVLSAPIAAEFATWTKGALSLTFTLAMIGFCLGGLGGGLLQKRMPTRGVVWLGASLMLAGFALTAKMTTLPLLYLGFGVLAGLGAGLSYNAAMSFAASWFPDRQGLISGVLLMGFGISSFLCGKVYAALAPTDGTGTWRGVLLGLGVVVAAVMAACGIVAVKPAAGWVAPGAQSSRKQLASYEEVECAQMVRRPSFWLFFVWTTLLSAAGLAVVSQGSPMAMEACPDLDMGTVATVVGLISIFNGVGRIVSGMLFDRWGRKVTMLTACGAFVVSMLLLVASITSHAFVVLVVTYVVTGLAYGLVPPTNSAFVSCYYGQHNYPVNLSVVNLNILISSFGSTLSGMVFDATQSYTLIALIVMGAAVVSAVASLLIREPSKA